MGRLLTALVIGIGGCSFTPNPAVTGDSTTTPGIDAPQLPDGRLLDDAAPIVDGQPAVTCNVPDASNLVLCLELDDPGLTAAKDDSGRGHDATVAAAPITSRDVPVTSQAVQVISTTTIEVPDSTDFNTQTFTLMEWVHRENTPGNGGAYGLIDVGLQYEMTIDDLGRLVCWAIEGGFATGIAGPVVTLNEWDLAACTYDGNTMCTYVLHGADGQTAPVCGGINKTANTSPVLGVSIGSEWASSNTHKSHLAGKLDSVRVFTRVLPALEICQAAGRTGC